MLFSTDQGSYYTSTTSMQLLQGHVIRISLDGRARWIDNMQIKRLMRIDKCEEICLQGFEDLMAHAEGLPRISIFMIL